MYIENILVWYQKMNMRQEISVSASISRYLHLDLLKNEKIEDSTFCLNPPMFSSKQNYWNMWLTGVFYCPGVSYYIDYLHKIL